MGSSSAQHHDVRVAIVGAGAGGLGLGTLLLGAGIDDIVVFGKGDGVGGTWRVTTYPGAECDVPSHLYSFSFALNPAWTKTFAGQAEILAYLERCAERSGLCDRVRTSTAVRVAEWDDGGCRWVLRTEHGDVWTAQVLVSAVGMFNAPAWPALEGLDDFAGSVMHSARWDHDVRLAGQRVGVVGTGAAYNRTLDDDLDATVWASCDSYFRTASGHIATQLPHPAAWYRRRTHHVDLGDYHRRPVGG